MKYLRPQDGISIEMILKVMGLDKNNELREAILHQLADNLSDNQSESGKKFRCLLNSLKIDGYRQGKAPVRAVINLISKIHYWQNEEIFLTIMEFWVDLHQPQIDQANAFYNKIKPDQCSLILEAMIKGDRPEAFIALVNDFRIMHKCSSEEFVELLLCTVFLFNNIESEYIGNSDDNETEPNHIGLPNFWANIIDRLNELPPDSDEWNALDNFISTAKEILSLKTEHHGATIEQLNEALVEFTSNCEQGLAYIGRADAANQWEASVCEQENIDKIIELMRSLREELTQIMEPWPTTFADLKEEKLARGNRDKLQNSIDEHFGIIDRTLRKTSVTDITTDKDSKASVDDEVEGPDIIDGNSDLTNEEVFEEVVALAPPLAELEDEEPIEEQGGKLDLEDGLEDDELIGQDEENEENVETDIESGSDEINEEPVQKNENCAESRPFWEIAAQLQSQDSSKFNAGLTELLWAEIKENRLSPAYWIARYLESNDHDEKIKVVPSWLIEFISLSRYLRHGFGPIAPRLEQLAQNFDESIFKGPDDWKNGMRFLIAGAMLRPAMIAPATGAAALLKSIRFKGERPHTYQIWQDIIEFGNLGHPLSLSNLGLIDNQAARKKQLDNLIDDASQWYDQAARRVMMYQPATQVWIAWQKSDGLISQIIKPVCENDLSQIENVRRLLIQNSNEQALKLQINETNKAVRKTRVKKEITGRGLTQLISHASDAFGYARQWLTLNDEQQGKNQDWFTEQVDKLKKTFERHSSRAIGELENYEKNYNNSLYMTSGISVFKSAILHVQAFFDGKKSLDMDEEVTTALILNHDLLRMPSVRLDEYFDPINFNSPKEIISEIVEMEKKNETDWEDIFSYCCEKGEHDRTLLILKYDKSILKKLDNDALDEKRNESIEEHRLKLKDKIAYTEKLIGEAVAQNLLTEDQYAEARSQIELIDIEGITFFPEIYSRLTKVQLQLDEYKKGKTKSIIDKLKRSSLDETSSSIIKKLIDGGDLGTAEEFLEMAESGEALPDHDAGTDDPFCIFFPKFINEFGQWMEDKGQPKKIISNIDRGQSFGPVKLSVIRGAQLSQASDSVRIWLDGKRTKKINRYDIKIVLTWLGFNILNVVDSDKSSSDRQWFKVKMETIRDGCPISAYGSDAKGNFRLLCVHGRPPEDQVVQQVAIKSEDGPCIVFYFGRMTERQFRDLSLSARKHNSDALFIDESGFFFMLGQRGAKLETLFQITLPFTAHNPYKPFATGNIPPEMFYGRSNEMQSIMDPHGACFIYGGRQLGKSALLRAVERKFYRPQSSHFAFFLDLKVEGLGESRPIDDIWQMLHRQLVRLGILQSQYNRKTSPDGLIEELIGWAESDDQKRLLVLLDEADHLLDEDAKKNFPIFTFIKKIMDYTTRRVKFIFAGLHNVQRFSRIPNQPLAHLGAPICIGPLLNNGEWREATNLIARPLNALGYRFEPHFLVNRILGHTNYQPSLIQLFCESLVKYLSNPAAAKFDQKLSPPFIITEKHVDDVYLNTQLRKTIKERFELTLNLDPRYRFIAFVIANGTIDRDDPSGRGFSVPWVTQEVNHWWPRGFADSSGIDDIRGLLDEMTGLGVLSKTKDERYRLRSSNVLRLLGNQEDIEHTLLSSDSWELPQKFHTSIYRRAGKGKNTIRRSPVTGDQESDLLYRENGIRLVFGSRALGVEDLQEYIEIARPDSPTGAISASMPVTIKDVNEFLTRLSRVLNDKKNGLNLIFIPPGTPFSELWVNEAARKLNALRSSTAICRLFFIFDPDSLLAWLKISKANRPENKLNNVQITSLKRWSESTVERWLNELALAPNNPTQREIIMSQTGGWPMLLYRFAELNLQRNVAWEKALDEVSSTLEQEDERGKFLNSVGLSKGTIQYKFMKNWAEIKEPLAPEDIIGLFDGFDEDQADCLLSYGEHLSICKPAKGNKWQQEALLAKLLRLE
ncbi:ATP-binding protein [Desulfosudis oleivorans]|nr:ATP-binding protein [Desulfosudis oleivorans]